MTGIEPLLTPQQVKAIRKKLGWSLNDMADALCLSEKHGQLTVRRWEMSEHHSKATPITGPAAVAMMAFLAGYEPPPVEAWGDLIGVEAESQAG